ncbi:uncharacterized protein ARMOST_08259 [Armillaria ostoyae]|uniref:F-box domain-containing protein n=1 Tax=Armillaria ostoyae TaxID=47428 RepID=A0A284R840_ARMOS|nr:uncharacterized protein ARMOST_08259 [Armillaria ostoyae]
MAKASLTDLPNELLAIIVQQISTEDRISLAHLCRRLNHVALSYQLYEKHTSSYSSFGHGRQFSDLRHLGLFITAQSLFSVIKLAFTSQYEEEMAEVQHYLDTIPYDPPAFHVKFLAEELCKSSWRTESIESSIQRFSSFCKGLVRFKCLSLTFPDFEASQLDESTTSFDVPALTTLQRATFHWTESYRLSEWFVKCINASPIEILVVSHEMDKYLPELHARNLRHMTFRNCTNSALSWTSFISRHAATLQILECPKGFAYADIGQVRGMMKLESVPHLTTVTGPILLLIAILSSEKAFLSLENIEIIEKGILWVGSGRQMEEMRILLHMISRIPSVRSLRSPFVDLVETASEWPPDEAMAAIPHIDRLTVTEPWLVPKENRYWLYRLFPNLMTHTEIWSGSDDFRSGFQYDRERLRF